MALAPLLVSRRRTQSRLQARSRPALALAPPRPIDPRLFEVQEHTLANGLRIRLLQDASVPAVSLYTFFQVGSRHERPGTTGIAHLFEHMMFNGAARYGPKEFDRVLEGAGGHSNAFTSHDVTAYYEDFAAEALGLVLDLESDRMRSLAITPPMLESERKVVMEERRSSVENEVLGVLDEELHALAYQAHPYRWPVIGWMADIENIRREDCLEFFRTYYAPNNAILWAVGDLRPAEALEAIGRLYGDIPAGPPVPAPASAEPEQKGERRALVRFPAHAQALALGYKAPDGRSPDAPVLDVIQYALTAGEGARLVRSLVYEKMLATNVFVDFAWHTGPGLFQVLVELAPGVTATRGLAALDRELEKVARKGLTDLELARAKGLLRSQHLREMATNNGRAHALGLNEVILGEWRSTLELPARYAAVGPEDVRRVAGQVLDTSRRSVVTLIESAREPAGAGKEEARRA